MSENIAADTNAAAGASSQEPVGNSDHPKLSVRGESTYPNPQTGYTSEANRAEMAVAGSSENHDSGAAEGTIETKLPPRPTGTEEKLSTEEKKGISNSDGIREKDHADEINQFDSISNAQSQPDITKQLPKENQNAKTFKRHDSQGLPQAPVHSQQAILMQKVSKKRVKKGIFVSYSPDAGFLERKFVVEAVRQFKENNLADDLWFDKDEKNTGSPCWFSLRMEAVEKCRAAFIILSDSYFLCPVSVYEAKALLERRKVDPHSVAIFPVLFSPLDKTEIAKEFEPMMKLMVDLTKDHAKKSLAEKTSVVVGSFMEKLEMFASMNLPPTPTTPPDTEFTGEYKRKKICQWNASDLQEWLFKLGIKEYYRQSLAENMVDGFLLMSLTDHDMVNYLSIDSKVVRKKIMTHILQTLDKEHKQTDSWHLRARAQRARPDAVYLIYDPADVRLAQNVKADLRKKGLQVTHHDSTKLGRSKEEFLEINGPNIATVTNVIVLLSEAAASSLFVFHEVLFSDWLGKKLVTAVFKNVWFSLRPSLKAVLGDCPAIDFETKMYTESLDVLEHHIKPLRRVPGVVLEQSYLTKMAEGLKPLEMLAYSRNGILDEHMSEGEPKVFISYQWDMQAKVEDIKRVLETNSLPCWADITINHPPNRSNSSRSTRSMTTHHDASMDSLQIQIQRNMKAASVVLSCITPKYLQSDNCKKDLTLAETFNKPIIPVLLRFSPLDSAPDQVRKILARLNYIDLSNERLYKQNIFLVLERIQKLVNPKAY
ncbi:hypothetical protein CHS0354_022133 [Potamilus streckersoni]|uniref:Uncharacterized protein n=1 Tax=Potamilus streckersoni TaxID=2493646 RepID=A0AAE0RSV9_9BIVA|nr:hypothetical protein CHS0354_022133 [Potamilus streckersoni]